MKVPSLISFTLPFSITIVLVLSCSPGLPSWTTFSSPGSKESSYSIIVSKGISFFSLKSWVPSGVPLPTWIRASSGSTLSTLGSPTTLESLIVHVVVIVPTLPGFTILYSPGLSSSDSSTLYPNGISSVCFTSPSVESSPTRITAFLGSLVVINSDVSVTWELTIVIVLSLSPDSPVCWTPSTSAYFHSPFLSVGSFLTSTSNGIVSVSLYWPSVLEPTLIFLLTGSFVRVVSPRFSSPAWPFVIVLVILVSCSPSSPFWSSTISPGLRLGSTVTSVSNGIGSLSTYSTVPVKSALPTSIISFTGAFICFGSEVFVTFEFSIVIVYSSSPSTPFWTTLYSPFLSSGFTLTSTSNGFLLV